MKTRILLLASLMGLQLAAHAQKYQMDVEVKGGLITSYLVNDLQDVVCKDTMTTITLSSKETIAYNNKDLASLSWTEYKGSQSEEKGAFELDVNHNAIVTPDYSVKFFAGSILDDTQLTVKRVDNAPNIIESGVDEMIVYSFTLDKPANFDGVAEIRVPIKAEEGDMVFGSYFNPELNKWDGIVNYYDEETGEVVISTKHFSDFGIFRIAKQKVALAKLQLLAQDQLINYIANPRMGLAKSAQLLREFTFSDNPDAAALEAFSGQYSDVSQIGLDIGYNAIKALGFESTLLDGFSEVLGHLGVALSAYQIARNDYHGNQAQLAGNTMKFTLNQCVSKLASVCSSYTMYACLASVAIMDYSINKFATTAHSGRRDMYVKTYNAWMDANLKHNGDWATEFKPYFSVFGEYTRNEIHDLIDEKVTDWCNKPWHDDFCAEYFYNATGAIWTYTGGLSDALCQELANNKKRELYDGDIPRAVERLKAELAQELYPKMRAKLEDYAFELNRGFSLILVDSSLVGKKDAKSAFAGYTVRFKDHPNPDFDGMQWETVLDETGWGEIGNRVGFLAYYNQKAILEVVSPKNEVVKVIHLKNLKAGYVVNGSRKNVDNYINIAPPQVAGVVANGKLYCSSSTYKKGETTELTPLIIAIDQIPNSIKVTYDENSMHVQCFKVSEDEDENYIVEDGTMISFDIDDVESMEAGKGELKNLYLDSQFSFSSGGDMLRCDYYKFNVTSPIPILQKVSALKGGSSGSEEGDDDDGDIDLATMLGASWGIQCQIDPSKGLTLSNFSFTKKEWIYKWDPELRDDVLDHIDEHVFSLQDNPGNILNVTVLFK